MLPVSEVYPVLLEELKSHNMVLLQAPPGAGKSTWLPLQLVREGHFKRIIMLEPRRLAARNIANYLAKCQKEVLGQSIGLRVRHEQCVSSHTQLEIVTEGILTRMIQKDPALTGVDCIIFDEFHERSIAADTALAFALESQSVLRDDLTLLLMSATLDSQKICSKFHCPVVTSQGRSYPVEEIYIPVKDEKTWLYEIPKIIKKAMSEQTGSCLVFLPGKREINKVAQQLGDHIRGIQICVLYGDQKKSIQQAALAPAKEGERKIVLATNVAETSLTIEGIRIVVDSGRKRSAKFNLNTGVTELTTVNISLASAIQRAGRAGRMEPGVVYRLGTKEAFNRREAHDVPEVLSSDISSLLLETKFWGTEINDLALLDVPTLAQQNQANQLLYMLEAVDDQNKLTALGKQLLGLGTDARWAHMLIKAKELESGLPGIELLSIYLLALLESRSNKDAELISALQNQLQYPSSEFTKLLNFWLKKLNNKPSNNLNVCYLPILLALAYPDRLAKKRGQGYLMANGAGVDSRDDYWVKDDFIAIAELGGKQGKYIFSATGVDIIQLQEYLPYLFNKQRVCEFIEKSGRFIYEDRLMLNAIVVNSKTINSAISEEARTSAWVKLIKKIGFVLFDAYSNAPSDREGEPFSQLLIRMTLAHQYFPKEYPIVNEQYLLGTLDSWLVPYLSEIKNVEQLKKMDIVEALRNCFDWSAQSNLNALLPQRLKVPSGSNVSITYQLSGPAKLSVRMQEVYGLSHTPKIGNGKISLLMDLLSPARRSLQLTQDLNGFWQGSYTDIQKEMKGRYPRHYWPDKPQDATATSKTKNKMKKSN